jgi:mono/diheme cytochrome c family protein
MDNNTVFFILGPCLVAIALIVSFVGLRLDKFPNSRGVLVGGTVLVAVLVLATMTFAWRNAEDEQGARDAELAQDVTQNAESGNTAEADEEAGSQAPTQAGVDGAEVFASAGCTGCHTLADAGSTGTTGPNLDAALKGQDVQFIRTSIIDPNDDVEKGYPPNVMPQTYENQLSPEELDALVTYLSGATGGGGKG